MILVPLKKAARFIRHMWYFAWIFDLIFFGLKSSELSRSRRRYSGLVWKATVGFEYI